MDFNVLDAARAGFRSVTYVVRQEILDDVKAHVHNVIGGTFETHFVCQELDQLPDGFPAPPDRVKPWGTAHAVLCAAAHIDGAFAVCNADDLYGAGAFQLIFDQMHRPEPDTEAALIGYGLDKTLSGAGGVARGVCVLGKHDLLERVTEVQDIRREVSEDETLLLEWLAERDVESLVAITKTDKLKTMKRKARLAQLKGDIPLPKAAVVATSSVKGDGVQDLWRAIHARIVDSPGEG